VRASERAFERLATTTTHLVPGTPPPRTPLIDAVQRSRGELVKVRLADAGRTVQRHHQRRGVELARAAAPSNEKVADRIAQHPDGRLLADEVMVHGLLEPLASRRVERPAWEGDERDE